MSLPIQFDRPGWLILLLLIVPAFLLTRRSIGGLTRGKAYFTFGVRTVVILLLTAALARPVWEERGEGLTVTLILDRSQSVPLALQKSALDFLREASDVGRRADDRLAVVTFAGEAAIAGMPDANTRLGLVSDPPRQDATNIAAGVRTSLALAPKDTANRFVVASDGNETEDSVLAAAEVARANNVPIDVLILEYEHAREVIFERLVAPPRARIGQTADLRLVLRSQDRATGRLTLSLNDEPVDLNGDDEGLAMPVTLEPGKANVFSVPVSFDDPGPLRFVANFEPDDVASDGVARNNRALAVTFVGGEGRVLIVDDGFGESEYLARALLEAGIKIDLQEAGALAAGPVYLSGYDAIVLANIPRYALTDDEDKALHAYVHDLGGGLVMLGGPNSFGAGGWIDSQTAKTLPVKLDPPQTRQMVRGALCLIMHATELPQGNFWGEKVCISAVEALSRLDYIGIIDFDWNTGTGSHWAFPIQEAGDKTAAIAAAKKMVMGDMPDFDTSMIMALNGLVPLSAGKKHVVIISDGDPARPSKKTLDGFVAAGITISTVLISGHGTPIDRKMMKDVATYTGGNFYEPKSPQKLPQIFIQEAQVVSRSLIVEGEVYQPQVVSLLPGPIKGFSEVPAVTGYVLTATREGLSQVPIVNATTEGNDPIYAYWNYGLGKSIAYTSDLTGRWGAQWAGWADFKAFWEQSIRWVMRPSAPSNMIINTTQDGDRAVVDLEALDADASYLNFLRTGAVMIGPDGEASPLVLQQTGPGRYRGEFKTGGEGSYLVNIHFAGGTEEDKIEGNIQAAVTVPYPAEFHAVTDNGKVLRELAEVTGGRVLSGADPALVDLYAREELEVPISPRAVWDLMAIIAAALFLFDVAARRISIGRRELIDIAGRAVGKRREVGTSTVAAWKRVAQRRPGAAPAPGTAAAAPGSARFEAAAADAATAIDVAGEARADARSGLGPPPPTPAGADQPEPGAGEGDYTSRLLKAKRRAQHRRDDAGEPTDA